MSDIHTLAEIGLAIALALAVDYGVARWIRGMLIVRAADRIADAYSTEQEFRIGSRGCQPPCKAGRYWTLTG
jgi:hypothetical protein